ncbi:MAG: enoyl-CoA hydratase-related protein, partial [Acidimicrobiia bacterium]|nr:enoyl-CoA hydratase-related protein [Acidimicrobiia bacterium]
MAKPEKRNALSQAHLVELLDAFRSAGASNARGVILAAEGPVFSAGHDFSDMAGRSLGEMRTMLGICADLMLTIQAIPQVVIAQVEGLATAAGCQLVASCDLAVAGASSRFQVPGGRGGWFCTTPGVALGRAIGRKRSLELLLTGDPIDADTALAWGLVNQVV